MVAKIAAALHAIMQDVTYVQRTGVNAFHKYRYASEADLLEKLRPALIRHGLILIPSTREVLPPDEHGNVNIIVDYILLHKDGDIWPEKIKAPGCGNDRTKDGRIGDKGLYKALTGANKYLLFKLFQIETGDDPERDDAEATKPQQQKAQQILPQADITTRGFNKDVTPEQFGAIAEATSQSKSKQVYIENAIKRMDDMQSASDLLRWATDERKLVWPQYGIEPHDDDGQKLVNAYKQRMAEFEQNEKEAE